MKIYLIAYLAAVLAFVVIDGIWLGLVAKNLYATQMGELLRKDILVAPAVGFYLAYTAGIVFLAVRPMQPELSLFNVAAYGAIVGFLAYGTYDMTNLSTVKDWPMLISFVDLVWGTALSASVATISAISVRHFA
ncbi:DUF2177 family protein [Granulosicoccus antarcticus]|uniref:DUF2177 family protein n=1 Tax=Granulosicoccus antarcticus IMCC3135 TaxID=1192854 RepID=A0A2Z2P0K6_9GAMM|nr:DUF2177 family protein [Granulosicoccus antarcticus]ASJ73004.1 hypothetical protein IMCC3135_14595 [Granulosicoccus antarcticus IMCC3135]